MALKASRLSRSMSQSLEGLLAPPGKRHPVPTMAIGSPPCIVTLLTALVETILTDRLGLIICDGTEIRYIENLGLGYARCCEESGENLQSSGQ